MTSFCTILPIGLTSGLFCRMINRMKGGASMKKRTHHYSLALRLFSSVILGMLALNILTIYSTRQRLGESAEENILREYRQVQVLYANEVEREMSEAQGRITDVSNAYMTAMAVSGAAMQDERQYEALLLPHRADHRHAELADVVSHDHGLLCLWPGCQCAAVSGRRYAQPAVVQQPPQGRGCARHYPSYRLAAAGHTHGAHPAVQHGSPQQQPRHMDQCGKAVAYFGAEQHGC